MMAYLKGVIDKIWRVALFGLWLFHGIVATKRYVGSASFEFSPAYLSLLFFLFMWVVFCVFMIILDLLRVDWWSKIYVVDKSRIKDSILVIAFLLVFIRLGLWYLMNLLGGGLIFQIGGYLNILTPILNLMAYISIEVVLVVVVTDYGLSSSLSHKKYLRSFVARFFFAFVIVSLLIVVIFKTGLGIYAVYKGDWQRGLPAVPFLEWQIVLASVLCLGMVVFEVRKRKLDFSRFDGLICFTIWAGASLFWLSQPVIPNASALTPHEPNYEIYPFIDSQTYDEAAQSILIGNGFGAEKIPQRPLYIVFLGFIHALVGQDYSDVIFTQTLFLAFFPALLFLIGRDLFGRPIGVSIALLAILRDYTSNIVSPVAGNLSYSKVYLSEMPTAIFLILLLILGMRWIKSGYPLFLGILIGGVLGLAMLVRTQVVVILPVILLFSLFIQRGNIRPMIKSIIFMLLMVIVVIGPWLWRNWRITGDLIFDNPESQTMNLALRYSRVNGVDWQVARLPGETSAEFSTRLQKIALEAISSNPTGAAWALASSFVNHGINNILLFPLRNEIKTFDDLVFPSDAFWEKWEGRPTMFQSIILGFYIFLFTLGVVIAWSRNGLLGLLPLGLNLAYNLWTSIALLSGQRFMLTMDWSIYFYYMVGIFSLIGCFLFTLNGSRRLIVEWIKDHPFVSSTPVGQAGWPKSLFFGMLFLFIGLSLPLAERVFPEKYPQLSHRQLLTLLTKSFPLQGFTTDSSCLPKLVNNERLSIVQGRALYPRYYSAKDGEDFTDTLGYKAVDYGRLVFDIIGQENHRVIFPMPQSPDFFPHASDITLVSDQNGKPWFVLVSQGGNQEFYASDYFDEALCD